jgi:hypothetical protein
LKNDNINGYAYKFLLPIISRLNEKYNFNHEINEIRIRRENILLPIDEKGSPDWAFMESYIREREENLITVIKLTVPQVKLHTSPARKATMGLTALLTTPPKC